MRTRQGNVVKKSILCIFGIFASTCLWADGLSSDVQSLLVVQNKIESYILNHLASYTEGKIKVSADKIDSRLKLKECADEKLEIFNPYESSLLNTNTMGIKCVEETNHWTLYVPVKVIVLKTVLLTKQALKKGTRLQFGDLYQSEMDAQKLKQGYFTDPKELVGLVCAKNIAPDTPLNPYNVELAKIVSKGQKINIIATNGSLNISMAGIALSDGVLGDVIKVKNVTSKKIIEAQISGKQKVKVTI
jgi:flagellar basal body P-ring formation protein FlgA